MRSWSDCITRYSDRWVSNSRTASSAVLELHDLLMAELEGYNAGTIGIGAGATTGMHSEIGKEINTHDSAKVVHGNLTAELSTRHFLKIKKCWYYNIIYGYSSTRQ